MKADSGITARQWYKGMALQALLARGEVGEHVCTVSEGTDDAEAVARICKESGVQQDVWAVKTSSSDSAEVACPERLSLARNYLAVGKPRRALSFLHRLLEAYPESDFAQRAEKPKQLALDRIAAEQKAGQSGESDLP